MAGVRWYTFWTVGWTGDRFCRLRRVTWDADLAAAYNFGLHRQFAGGNALGNADECPAGTPAAVEAAPTPDQLAREFWDVRLLPAPSVKMEPGYAVTGKPVYLEIHGQKAMHFDVPNPIGPAIGIDARSHYLIDWGDGTSETTTSAGGPWPDGDVTHVYTHAADTRTITVTQVWSASWQAGDQGGNLDNLRTGGTLTFAVTQVQAVRS